MLFKYSDAIMVGALTAILSQKVDIKRLFDNGFLSRVIIVFSLGMYILVEIANRKMIMGIITVPFSILIQSTCFAIWLIYSITQKSFLTYILNMKLIKFVGVCSYSIYIWQQVFLIPIKSPNNAFWSDGMEWLGRPPINLLLALAAGIFSYYLIEKPFRKSKSF